MNRIMELRSKRNTLWEQTKAFLEEHRGENDLVDKEAVEQYNKMAADVKALGDEIARLEDQAAMDAELSMPTSKPALPSVTQDMPKKSVNPLATEEYSEAFWNIMRNEGDQAQAAEYLRIGKDDQGGFTVPDEFERMLVKRLEENNIFRRMAHVIRTNSGTRKIPVANDIMEASWIDEGEEIPETNTKFSQTTLSAYKLGAMIKVSNELLHDSAFDIASYIAERFGIAMGNAEEAAFISGDGDKKPTGLLADTGAEPGATAANAEQITFDDIFRLYYSLRAPYRRNAAFLTTEAVMLQLMTLKDGTGNYIWKPSLDIAKPDTVLGRPVYTSTYMPEPTAGSKAVCFGDYSYYWVADRSSRTFRRLNELYARTDQVGFLTTQRVDGKLILPETVKYLAMPSSNGKSKG